MIRRYWEKLSKRRSAAAVLVLVAIGLQLFLVNLPLQLEIGNIRETVPEARRGQQLMIEVPPGEDRDLLIHHGRAEETVEVRCERAQLAAETLQLLKMAGLSPPTSSTPIDYITDPQAEVRPGSSCRTTFLIKAQSLGASPARLYLFQRDTLPAENYRTLELKATGARLTASIKTVEEPGGEPQAFGCLRKLKVGDWTQSLGPSVGISIVADENSSFRFRSHAAGQTSFDDRRIFELIEPPLSALRVEVQNFQKPQAASLALSSSKDTALLQVWSIGVGSDHLQLETRGKGWVRRDGEYLTYNFLDRLKNYPILAGALAAIDAALLNWLKTLFFSRPPKRAAKKKDRQNKKRNSGTAL